MNFRSAYWITFWFACLGPLSFVVAQPSFTLNGSTIVVSEHCYRLTSHKVANDVGSLWCEFPLELQNAFDIRFSVNLGCSRYAGEGMAFVMHTHKDGYDALGCEGGTMGFAKQGTSTVCAGISPSLAIEIDTKYSRNHHDIHKPHLAIVQDGNINKPLTEPVEASPYRKDVLDCEYHNMRVTWAPSTQELSVYFDGELRITYTADITTEVFAGVREIYFGFTGSTSAQANMQMVCVQSVIVEIDEAFSRKRSFADGVGIFPNPLRERLTIDIELDDEEYVQMQLYDSTGKLIYEIPTHLVRENQYFFNLPGLPSGVYFVTVTNGRHRVSKKIVHISTIRA